MSRTSNLLNDRTISFSQFREDVEYTPQLEKFVFLEDTSPPVPLGTGRKVLAMNESDFAAKVGAGVITELFKVTV